MNSRIRKTSIIAFAAALPMSNNLKIRLLFCQARTVRTIARPKRGFRNDKDKWLENPTMPKTFEGENSCGECDISYFAPTLLVS